MLKLNKLTLENFGHFTEPTDIVFKDGFNILQADNGKGKSTILQAIELLLLDVYEGTYENYINWNAPSFKTSLDFDINSIPYSIELTVSRGKSGVVSSRSLKSKGKELARGDDAKNYLAELLDPNITRYALISKQENADNIVTAKDSERLTLIKKIKNFEFEKEVKEEIEPRIKYIEKDLIDLDKKIYNLTHKDYELKQLQSLPFSEKELIDIKKEIDFLKIEQKRNEQLKAVYLEKLNSKRKLEEQIASNNKTLQEKQYLLNKEKENLEVYNDEYLQSKVKSITDSIRKEEQSLIFLKQSTDEKTETLVSKYDTKLQEITTQIAKNTDIFSNIKSVKISKYDEELLKNLLKEKYSLQAQINTLNKNIKTLESGECPTCHQSCSNVVQHSIDELNSLSTKLLEVETKIQQEEETKKKIEEKIKAEEENRKYKNDLEVAIVALTKELEVTKNSKEQAITRCSEQYSSEYSLISMKIEQLKSKIQEVEESFKKELEYKKNSISLIETLVGSLQNQVAENQSSLKQTEEELNRGFDIDTTIEEKLIDKEKQVAEYMKVELINKLAVEHNNKVQEYIIKDKEELVELEKTKAETLLKKENFEQARTILLKDFPNFMIDKSIQDIEDAMNYFINVVYYKDLNIRLRSTKTVLKLEYGKNEKGYPASRLSGAEKRIVQLSFINYFNRLLGLKCIILDEPDAAMDGTRKKELYEAILTMKEVFGQVIIVTHSQEMKQYLITNIEPNIITL